MRMNALECRLECARAGFQVVIGLQPHPELGAVAKVTRQAQRRIGRYAPLFTGHVVDARRGHLQRNCKCVGREPQGQEEFFAQHLAGVDGTHSVHNIGRGFPSLHDLRGCSVKQSVGNCRLGSNLDILDLA